MGLMYSRMMWKSPLCQSLSSAPTANISQAKARPFFAAQTDFIESLCLLILVKNCSENPISAYRFTQCPHESARREVNKHPTAREVLLDRVYLQLIKMEAALFPGSLREKILRGHQRSGHAQGRGSKAHGPEA
jgi:hypothetical protein